jgi:hypothetical protein
LHPVHCFLAEIMPSKLGLVSFHYNLVCQGECK